MAVDDVHLTGLEVTLQCSPTLLETTAARAALLRGLPGDRARTA